MSNLKTPLELDIYWKNDAACQLEELGVPISEQNGYKPSTTKVTFYSVDYVSRGNIVGVEEETGFISSGGEEFGTNMSYAMLKTLIANHCNF